MDEVQVYTLGSTRLCLPFTLGAVLLQELHHILIVPVHSAKQCCET